MDAKKPTGVPQAYSVATDTARAYETQEQCTCLPTCAFACKGECGCQCCYSNYMDFLSARGG